MVEFRNAWSRGRYVVSLVLLAGLGVGCARAPQPDPAEGDEAQMAELTLTSTAFDHQSPIPEVHSQDGQNTSPPLVWSGVPKEAQELVLIVDDPDAPMAEPYVHWVLYGMAPDTDRLAKGVPKHPTLTAPEGARQGMNTAGKVGYDGPAPPPGHGIHHYHFKLYAVDRPLGLKPKQTKADVLRAMKGHVIAQGEFVGTYER